MLLIFGNLGTDYYFGVKKKSRKVMFCLSDRVKKTIPGSYSKAKKKKLKKKLFDVESSNLSLLEVSSLEHSHFLWR